MRPSLRRAAVALSLAALVVGCDDDAAEEAGEARPERTDEVHLVAEGALTVCLDAPVEPFVVEDDDAEEGVAGFEVEVLREVADRLDLRLDVVAAPIEQIQSGAVLADERCDLGGSGLEVTERRAEQVDFSRPFVRAHQALLLADDADGDVDETDGDVDEADGDDDVDAGDDEGLLDPAGPLTLDAAEDLADLVDLEGRRVGVWEGGDAAVLADDHLDDTDVIWYEQPGDLVPALLRGEVDVVLRDLTVGAVVADEVDGVRVAATVPTGRPYAFALRSGRTDGLAGALDGALEQVIEDGTRDRLFDEAFGLA